MNNLRPVALTSAIMKVCKRIVFNRFSAILFTVIDPSQFAYRKNRCIDDAIVCVLNSMFSHLEKPKPSVRLMFYDFSSALNTIQSHIKQVSESN